MAGFHSVVKHTRSVAAPIDSNELYKTPTLIAAPSLSHAAAESDSKFWQNGRTNSNNNNDGRASVATILSFTHSFQEAV